MLGRQSAVRRVSSNSRERNDPGMVRVHVHSAVHLQTRLPKRLPIVSCTAQPTVQQAASRITVSKPTLFDIPVSNNGARVRWIIYKKGLDIDIVPPSTVGGLKSEAYLAANPQGKMPLLVLPNGLAIPESVLAQTASSTRITAHHAYHDQVIVQYLLRACTQGPSLTASSPEKQALADLATRIMDVYINSVQGCLYKEGDASQRAKEIAQLAAQLDVLERLIIGPYVAGQELTSADGAMLATFAWLDYILPRKFGWSPFTGRPGLTAWYLQMQRDDAGSKVTKELQDGLAAWDEGGRWEQRGIAQQLQDTSYRWRF